LKPREGGVVFDSSRRAMAEDGRSGTVIPN
jgi:hypothetical protein